MKYDLLKIPLEHDLDLLFRMDRLHKDIADPALLAPHTSVKS